MSLVVSNNIVSSCHTAAVRSCVSCALTTEQRALRSEAVTLCTGTEIKSDTPVIVSHPTQLTDALALADGTHTHDTGTHGGRLCRDCDTSHA